MRLNLRAVANYMRRADTEELLDRVTVYRNAMEPAAVDLIEGELSRRGVTSEQIAEHEQLRRAQVIILPDGTALRCSFCGRPAVARGTGWQRLLGLIPIYPRMFAYCDAHVKKTGRCETPTGEGEAG
jgi:predicted phosphoribosyltransferase